MTERIKNIKPIRRGIWADPNPLPASGSNGLTTVYWSTGNGNMGEVCVVSNGRNEVLFAQQPEGSKDVDWIQHGVCYEFRLYEYLLFKKRLVDQCVVTKGADGIFVSPNPVHIDGDLGWSILKWTTDHEDVELYVSCNNERDILCASGKKGGMVIDWLKPNHIYDFKLISCVDNKIIDSVVVCSDKPFIHVVPSFPELKTDYRKTVIWSSGNDAVCEVYSVSNDNEEVLFATGVKGAQKVAWLAEGAGYEFRLYEGGNRSKLLKTTKYQPLDDRRKLLDALLGGALLVAAPLAYLLLGFSRLRILLRRNLFLKRNNK